MKIKSLLLGSAAAMMAVSTAQAADIIIPEPEVVEYVRVCDAAGTGFFYIPGTETCLRIHGYVRYEIGFGETHGVRAIPGAPAGNETYNKLARASFRVSTWADTEYGPLRTYVETRWNWQTAGGATTITGANPQVVDTTGGYTTGNAFTLNFAWIDLGGLRLGKSESFFTTFTGYAGGVMTDGTYGPFDTNLISYTFNSGAFSAGVSLEQGNNTLATTYADVNGDGDFEQVIGFTAGSWGIDDYVPHIVAGAGYDGGAFNIRGVVGYDTRNGVGQGGWTGKLRGDVSFDPFSAFVMLMYGENSSAYTTWRNGGGAAAETFSVIGGASFDFTDQATFNAQVQWIDGAAGQSDRWIAAANVNYELVDGFTVRPELVYTDGHAANDSAFGGRLRFERTF